MTEFDFEFDKSHYISFIEVSIEFGKGQYINFIEVSIANRGPFRHWPCETTSTCAPDEPPNGCLGDPAPFLLVCISKLVDDL